MVTSNNGGRYGFGFRVDPANAEDLKRRIHDIFRERYPNLHMHAYDHIPEDEMPGPNNDQRREKVDPKTGRKFKNLNHPTPKRPTPLSNQVCLDQPAPASGYDRGTCHVRLPRRGSLGDGRLCDESGLPINVGPTYRGPSEFPTIDAALDHFRRVARNFDKLNGIGE